MPRYMLDTDTCSSIMKRSHPTVLKRLQAIPVNDVCMSVISKAELLYGVRFHRGAPRMPRHSRHSSPM
jgi:tRNA(fMet)-specific endonuclease VapC